MVDANGIYARDEKSIKKTVNSIYFPHAHTHTHSHRHILCMYSKLNYIQDPYC